MRHVIIICLVIMLVILVNFQSMFLFSEESDESETEDTEETDNSGGEDITHEPVPYSEDEFPRWLRKLRRAEIITFGSLPITLLLTFLTYDIIRYGIHDWHYDYRPLGNPNRIPYTTRESICVILTGCGISIIIALADYIVGKVREKRQERELEVP